jgi:uncharacterized protein (TIGR00266 family)
MEIELLNRPSSTVAKVTLGHNEKCIAEGGSMVAMNGSMTINTTTHQKGKGGIIRGLKRLLGGESFFLNHYQSSEADDKLWLSHALPGDMEKIEISPDQGIVVSGGCFVACDDDIEMDMSWQGMKSLFSGEGLFWLKMKGTGPVIVSSYGAIYSVMVEDGYIVDTGHIVAYEDTLNFSITKAGGSWIQSFLGGEGFVCKFKGRGRIWCQSHNSSAFGKLLGPKLRPRRQ